MNREDAKIKVLENIDSPGVAKEVMHTFLKLTLDKPSSLNWDQEVLFVFLMRWGMASSTLWHLFFPTTIKELWQGTPSENIAKPIPDVFSIPVVLRSLYEDYLLAFTLLDQDTPTSARRCRYLAWVRRGRLTKKQSAEHFRASAESLTLTSDEFNKADKELQTHAEFVDLDKGHQKRLLKHGWNGSWASLAQQAGVCEAFHNYFYGEICGYAHSDFSSFEQVLHGQWGGLSSVSAREYIHIAALMLDLTRQHLFRAQINENIVLDVVMEYGLGYTRGFDRIASERRAEDEPTS